MEKRRSIPVAVLLSLAMPGFGHLYCGRLDLAPGFWVLSFLGWGVFLIGFGTGALDLQVAYQAMLVSILLVWAGVVEAFFSQYHEPVLPYWLKITFGCVQLVVLAMFLALAGRRRGPEPEADA